MAMLVDSGATEYMLGDELVQKLNNISLDHKLLDNPNKITPASTTAFRTTTSIIAGAVTGGNEERHKGKGLPRNHSGTWASSLSMVLLRRDAQGSIRQPPSRTAHPTKGDIVVPIQQPMEDNGSCTFDTGIDTGIGTVTSSMSERWYLEQA